ncbi:MAG: hypothetical protein ACK4SZ_09560 [Allosphingosinicella sp.]|uniref:hypothetical protein n=1 Tax=Allosphingosinicella sp. TaxID=2823234 RepID=UPI003962135D
MRKLLLLLAAFIAAPAAAQDLAAPRVQTPAEALAQDSTAYANLFGVAPDEALRRLRAQELSVAPLDRLLRRHRDRIAGVSVQHDSDYRIVVRLTGERPVRDSLLRIGGIDVSVRFITGAAATREQVVAAMRRHREAIVAATPGNEGMGFDPRTGELVVLGNPARFPPELVAETDARLEALTGVPVRLGLAAGESRDADASGGARVEGINPASGRRTWCTAGFAVTDGARTGLTTAAHCADDLSLLQPDGRSQKLTFVGGWGAGSQDVQVHVSDAPLSPLFYADADKQVARPFTGARRRETLRAGDIACHRGETSGYGCAEIQLTDYAPPGAMCGGPCEPTWITVKGPRCGAGDSGGPIFVGTIALGLNKGGNWTRSGSCNFYYFMSVDFLPEGWRLLTRDLAERLRVDTESSRPLAHDDPENQATDQAR